MSKSMNAVMIIPTGIGCEIGGHAGDATPAARLLGSVCDKLILHPNVVNASDINEMPENALYVEGSILDRFLLGRIELKEVKSNRILVVVNSPVRPETVNAVSASRATLGIDVKIVELDIELELYGEIYDGDGEDGLAGGVVRGWEELVEQVKDYEFDALAISSLIKVDREVAKRYFKEGGVNPWGGIEALLSKLVSTRLNKPVAHSPIQPGEVKEECNNNEWDFVCDPRMAAEIISECFLHCILKGLHKAPRICLPNDNKGLSVKDIDIIVSPMCWGRPHKACTEAGIPIIFVEENKTIYNHILPKANNYFVNNYLEAAGVIVAMKEGICLSSLRRPLPFTEIINA